MRQDTDVSDQVGPYNFQNNYPIATKKRCLLFKNRPDVISKLSFWKPDFEQCFPNNPEHEWMTKHIFFFFFGH